jgi:SulP family sulfate permease
VTPTFDFIDFAALSPKIYLLIVPALTIALVSALEGLMSASVAESLTGTPYDANAELVGHGIANLATGFCGALPVTGALARTNVNISNGAKSPLAGIFSCVIILVFYLALMPAMQFIPMAALAAALIRVAINMSRFKLAVHMAAFGKRDSAMLIFSFLVTVIFGVLYGVLASIALAFLCNIHSFRQKMTVADGQTPTGKTVERPPAHHVREVNETVVRKRLTVKGSVFFVNIQKLIGKIRAAATDADEIHVDMQDAVNIDATSVERLAKLAQTLAKNEKRLVLEHLSPRLRRRYIISFEKMVYSWN